jgi:hypothetical protein
MGLLKYGFVKVCHIEFQQNLWNGLWDILKIMFAVFCPLGFSMDLCDTKSELPYYVSENVPYPFWTTSVEQSKGYIESPLIALCGRYFIMDQYDRK